MIRTHWMTSSSAAKDYFAKTDYYATCPGDWLGKGASMLGLHGDLNQMHFWSLADNLHPQSGEQLTTYTRDGRRVGLDMTFNATKSVSIARELAGLGNAGDPRIEQAHREAVAHTVGLLEKDMQGRVRTGGAFENRTTGNLVAYRVTHRDTRINADDQRPDMSLHDHVFIFNATWDAAEGKWKAAELGQIKHDLPFYEAVYHNRLAANLKALGYGIERKGKAFELTGVSRETIDKFSRRSAYIEKVAGKLGITKPESKAKLGATTRLGKAKELADDLNGYYVSRLTDVEKQQLATLEGRSSRQVSAETAVRFAIGHLFERKSVVEAKKVYEVALRHGIGAVTPEAVQAEAKRQGLLVKNGDATTRDVLAEEQRVIAFARDGRGTCRPMGARPGSQVEAGASLKLGREAAGVAGAAPNTPPTQWQGNTSQPATLAAEQQAVSDIGKAISLSPEQSVMVNHVLTSTDRVMLVRGAAGTGKTFAMRSAVDRISRPVVVLAPSAAASRGVLRSKDGGGFSEADTVARFLTDERFQEKARDGVIWVDEAALMPIQDTAALFAKSQELGARVVLQGDPKQHRAVARDGNLFHVLQKYAGLPVVQLTDIRRQRGRYKEAVAAIEKGEILTGHDILADLGWVKQTPVFDHNQPLVDAFLAAVDSKRRDQDVDDRVIVVAPTHEEGREVTAAIRAGLKARGLLGIAERTIQTLTPLHWSEPERADLERFEGTEVVQWHRNGGTFKAGDRIAIADFKTGQRFGPASTYAVFAPTTLALAEGDRIRITKNGWTADGKHRLDNGAKYTVAGFEDDGRIRLTNGWQIPAGYGHLAHGYTATSIAGQGKTVDRVLIAMGHESLPAVDMAQFYVSASRARDQATIFTNVAPSILREAIQKADTRKSATELIEPMEEKRRREWWLARRARQAWEALRSRVTGATQEQTKQRENYGRG